MRKAVILARGLGTRMRKSDESVGLDQRQAAMADTGIKALIPIDRPFLDYVLTSLCDAGYEEVCLVVAPQHDVLRDYYGNQAPPQKISIHFAVQVEPRGTADAVAAARQFAGNECFLVVNSDNYYPQEGLRGLRAISGHGVALFEREAMFAGSNIAADRIRQFAVGDIDPQQCLRRILEKPTEATLAALPQPLWLSMNCWRFGPAIFEACSKIPLSARGELEITDAVQYTIDVLHEPFHVVPVRAPVLDMTSRRDVASIAEKLKGTRVEY